MLLGIMLNQSSVLAVNGSTFSTQFVRPLYDSYCFSRIPDTILKLLFGDAEHPLPEDAWKEGDQREEIVVVFLVDGFGWKFFEKFSEEYPFLKRFLDQGRVSKITSQFPSTTAAHVTTMNTGLEVGQTGVYEWFYYEPLVDCMISPLIFSEAGDHLSNTLSRKSIPPEEFFPSATFYQSIAQRGGCSYLVLDETIAHSPYTACMSRGAEVVSCSGVQGALEKVVLLCQKKHEKPTYIYCYLGEIDAKGHRHGIYSTSFLETVANYWQALEEQFWQKIQGISTKISIIVTADHGMVPVSPKTTRYLNQIIPDIETKFKKNKASQSLVPAGSCRDFFLHVEESHLVSLENSLRQHLNGVAEIYPTQTLIQEGFFGREVPAKAFIKRVGNLVILPYEGESVWWFQKHRFEQHFYAAHGGLTPSEMESIFLFQRLISK